MRSPASSSPTAARVLAGRRWRSRLALAVAIGGALALTAPASASAAFDTFMTMPKFVGESQDDTYKGWIELDTATLGIKRASRATSPSFIPLVITKRVDLSTPNFFDAVGRGTLIPNAWIYVRKAGGAPTTWLKYALENVVVLTQQMTIRAGDDTPWETITLTYGKATVSYAPADEQGELLDANVKGWNLINLTPTNVFREAPSCIIC